MKQITIEKKVLDEIFEQAIKEYPDEACGWIMENSDKTLSYSAGENLQNKYHKLDPEAYPRTGKDAFLMDSLKLSRAIEKAENEGGNLFSIVHSHIDCGAYFSAEDKIQMTLQDNSAPVFPAQCYLVVSIVDRKPGEIAAFAYDSATSDYQALEVLVQ